jgi:carboxylesterase
MTADEAFAAAQTRSRTLSKTPGTSDLLELYALFKQATVGDVTGSRPGMLDLKGRAKHDAWAGKRGTPAEAAKQAYVALVERLAAGAGQ